MAKWKSIRDRFRHRGDHRIEVKRLQQLQDELLEESTIDLSYLILVFGSCAIATFGLLSNSTAVIIGAMIIAPLMLPIRGLAFGALEGDVLLFRQSFVSVAVGTSLAVVMAWSIGSLVSLPDFGSEILSRSRPTLLDLGIAVAAGGISGYAKVQPKISGSLAGTAIAVALMPPLCVIGLGLSRGNMSLSQGATLLYLTNLLGITLSCMLTFLLTGCIPLQRAKRALGWTVGLTSMLIFPLTISFAELVRQAQLQNSLESALVNRTITFQRMELLSVSTNWLSHPPEVRLNVRSQDPITPKQVELLEEFIELEMGRPFTLIFIVGQVEEITRNVQPLTFPDSKFDIGR